MGFLSSYTQAAQPNATPTTPAATHSGMPTEMRDYLSSMGVNGPNDLTWHSGDLSDDLSTADRNDMWGGVRHDLPGNTTDQQEHIGTGWRTPTGQMIGAGVTVGGQGDMNYIMNQSQDGQNRPVFGAYKDAPDISLKDAAMAMLSVYGMGMGLAGIGGMIGGMGGVEGMAGMEGLSGMDLAADGAMPGWGSTAGVGLGTEMANPWGDVNGMDFNSDLATRTGTAPAGSVNAGVNVTGAGGFSVSPQQVIKQVINQANSGGGQPVVQQQQQPGGVQAPQATDVTNAGGAQSPQTANTGGNMPITTGTGTPPIVPQTGGTGGAQAPQTGDLASTLLGIGGGLWDMNNQNQASGQMLDYLRGRQQMNDNMYAPGSNEYNALWDEMSRKDAAAGRNSQYGPRSVDLAARVAQLKMDANTKMTTGISHYMAQALNQRASSPAGLISALNNGGLSGLTRLITGQGGGGVNVPGGGSGGTLSPGNTGGNGTGTVHTGGDNNGPGDTEGNGVNPSGVTTGPSTDGATGYDGNPDYDNSGGIGDNFDLSDSGVGDWGDFGANDWSDWDNFDWAGSGGFDDFSNYDDFGSLFG
jgi:hypothetical protein